MVRPTMRQTFARPLVIVAVLALVASSPLAFRMPTSVHAGERASPPSWHQFHFTPDHRGLNLYETTLGPSSVSGLVGRWLTTLNSNLSGPAVVGNAVYVGEYFGSSPDLVAMD